MRPMAIKHGITDNYYTTKRQGGTAPHVNEFLRKTNSITENEKKSGGGGEWKLTLLAPPTTGGGRVLENR